MELLMSGWENEDNMLQELKNYEGKNELISSAKMAERLAKVPTVPRYKYGISNIDYLTEGFETGEVIVITGWSGYGKTTFCQTMLTNFSRQGLPILSISYEGKLSQFFRKLSNPLPNFYLPKKNKSYDMDWMEERIREAALNHGVKVVLLDHLHFIINPPGQNMRETYMYTLQVGVLIRRIKDLAVELDVAIFLVAHCAKPPRNETGKPPPLPQKADLKDSSAVEQDSDAVYVIQRVFAKPKGIASANYEATDETQFYIIKQRENGNLGKIAKLIYSGGELVPKEVIDERAL